MTTLFFFLIYLQKQELTVAFFPNIVVFSNQGNKVLYIGMLRHCTVTAVKTQITRVSCPDRSGLKARQMPGRTGEDTADGEDGCSAGCPGMTNLTYRFVQSSPQSI